jgi:hypothetical protein
MLFRARKAPVAEMPGDSSMPDAGSGSHRLLKLHSGIDRAVPQTLWRADHPRFGKDLRNRMGATAGSPVIGLLSGLSCCLVLFAG